MAARPDRVPSLALVFAAPQDERNAKRTRMRLIFFESRLLNYLFIYIECHLQDIQFFRLRNTLAARGGDVPLVFATIALVCLYFVFAIVWRCVPTLVVTQKFHSPHKILWKFVRKWLCYYYSELRRR